MTDDDDSALWQTARATLPEPPQREGLTAAEQVEEEALLALYRQTILTRAQAAVLLKQRGYDVSDPGQFSPLA